MKKKTEIRSMRVESELFEKFKDIATNQGKNPNELINYLLDTFVSNPATWATYDLLRKDSKASGLMVILEVNLTLIREAGGNMSPEAKKKWQAFMSELGKQIAMETKRIEAEVMAEASKKVTV